MIERGTDCVYDNSFLTKGADSLEGKEGVRSEWKVAADQSKH